MRYHYVILVEALRALNWRFIFGFSAFVGGLLGIASALGI